MFPLIYSKTVDNIGLFIKNLQPHLMKRASNTHENPRKKNKETTDSAPEFQPIQHFRPPSFPPDQFDAMNTYLREHGYAVVRIYKQEDPIAKQLMDKLWEHARRINNRIDPTHIRETCGNADWIGTYSNGIVIDGNAGQSDLSWTVRGIPAVRQVFQSVWCANLPAFADPSNNDRGMFTSFDGFNAMRPTAGNLSWATKGGWWHVDQVGSGFQCAQGLLNLLPCLEDYSPSFSCVPGSHKSEIYEQYFVRDPKLRRNGRDWVVLKRYHFANAGVLQPIVVQLDAGELLLWDSRLIHANDPGSPARDPTKDRLRRACVYVCMTPAMLAGSAEARKSLVEQRLEAVRLGQTTTHWPHKFQLHSLSFRKRLHAKRLQETRPQRQPYVAPKLTEAQKHLVTGT